MIPVIISAGLNFFLIESPRYYLDKDHEKVVDQFNKYAKINKTTNV